MPLVSVLEDEILNLTKQLNEERSIREDLEKFKRDELERLRERTEDTIQKTKSKFFEEIELLKNERKSLQIQLESKEREIKDLRRIPSGGSGM